MTEQQKPDVKQKEQRQSFSTTDYYGRTKVDIQKLFEAKWDFLRELATPPGSQQPIKERTVIRRDA